MDYRRYRPVNRRQALRGLAGIGAVLESGDLAALTGSAARRTPIAWRVPAALPDALEALPPSAVQLDGWLGERINVNARQRLLNVDTAPLLAGFRDKPGSHPWIGEHIGKWLHAATLAWAYGGDERLRDRIERAAGELIAAQESDGYLGTYLPAQRFGLYEGADWDVWSHKYGLIGLLTYYRYTGDAAALAASRRAADLLVQTFPARRSILAAGTHRGLAATSVLEPIVHLYRLTADLRYLDFARYIVRAWDEADGPALVATLLRTRRVDRVAPPKAYEMLSNLVGLVEFARVTGDADALAAAQWAWEDIVDRRLYVSGATSQGEHFQADHDYADSVSDHVGETCVTTTWIQLSLLLLELTGRARYADEVERATYNHLTAAQHPSGDDWCYFTPLHGHKRYLAEITCCHSSGPRGIALAPTGAYHRGRLGVDDALVVSTFEPSRAVMTLDGLPVSVEQVGQFPRRGGARLVLRMARPARFALKVRQPPWASAVRIAGARQVDGWQVIAPRRWRDGDTVEISYGLAARTLTGTHGHAGRAAIGWGPFVLAYDSRANPRLPDVHRLGWTGAPARIVSAPGEPLRFAAPVAGLQSSTSGGDAVPARASAGAPLEATLLTYADAGAQGGLVRVWLRAPGRNRRADGDSLLLDGVGSCSRGGQGSPAASAINDDDLESGMSTFDGGVAEEDWFAVTLQRPVTARRVVFAAGRVTERGGWFDTRLGKPLVQVRAQPDAHWQTVGRLDDYPDTTDSDARGVGNDWDLVRYTCRLASPLPFFAVRVIGRPAGGRDGQAPYVTCAELQAFTA